MNILTKQKACILHNSILSYPNLILTLTDTFLTYPNPNG